MKTAPTTGLTDAYPLSPMQQGMLFHSLSSPRGVDVEQIFCALHEDLNAAAFQSAWRRAVARHAALRTSFHWQDSTEPRQQVHPQVELEFSRQDWSSVSESKRKALFSGWLESDRQRGFDLAHAPLMRLALFCLGQGEWQFLWTVHHLLVDGRTVVILLNEVFALYEAFCRGEELELPPPPAHRDFVAWLRGRQTAGAEGFWRRTLKGFSAPTPFVFGRSASEELEGLQVRGEQQVRLPEAATRALKSVAKENQVTLNTMVLGAWALLLSRYGGEEDVLFGVVRACRHSTIEGAESIVGLCINTVPLRIRVRAQEALLPWLAGLRSQWVALREFEHTSLADIQSWSELPRGQGLFETLFNFQDPSWDAALRAQGGRWAGREFGLCSQSNYPLVVDACGGEALQIKLLYHRTRFEDASITRMLGHFRTLLEGMASNPAARLADLPMLTPSERRQLLVEWNNTRAEFPRDKCVHQLFEEQAARTPDAPAVTDERASLTYRELNDRAGRLAAELRGLGVGPEVCAGVCLERGVNMVVAMLAVLKAGGAYVPLDAEHPHGRLAFMLRDTRMPVLITRESMRANFGFHLPNLQLLCVDSPAEARRPTEREAGRRPQITNPKPGNLAYVIYTSGSTGLPKGVEIEHAGLVNLIAWHQRAYAVTPADRAAQIAAPAFDASVWELWPYLTAGAGIHIPGEETRLSPAKLVAWLAAKGITLAFVPTPLAEAMLAEPWPENCALRALLTGGDKLHHAPGLNVPCALVNHYGPAESTVVTTRALIPPGKGNGQAPPIGRPIANTQVYILDARLQPVPVGMPGQLHIGGAGLARGYHNRPALTAEKFISNPFPETPSARLYRTGDLVRWLPHGQIEFLGRLDNQVKIRGQRIEPGEIEAVLLRSGDVREALVVASADARGENRLAAYVVPAPAGRVTPGALREFLKQKLPAAMVPSAFVFLESLPLTPNGKVDRHALPPPDFTGGSERTFVAPRTPTEAALARIWSEVLGREQVGVHDNFFDLGGHSLRATQVMARALNTFHVEVPLPELFASPTLAELAGKIDTLRRAPRSVARGSAPPEGEAGAPLAFAQERLWFMEQLEPGQSFNNIPVALRLEGALEAKALERAVSEIVRRHKTFRTTFHNAGGRPVAVASPEAAVNLPTVDLSSLTAAEREAEAERLRLAEARQPFDLAQSPLLRAKLIRLAEDEHLLLLTTHHIVCDGWSLGVLYRELSALYRAFREGKASPLPELQADYADFARSQRRRLHGGALEGQLNYWKQQLTGAQTTLDLPTDRPRPPAQTFRGTTQPFTLPAELAAGLARLSRNEEVTLYMTLLAAFQTLLHRLTGQHDILVGSPVAGRAQVETEALIGCFLNTLVLRGDLSGDPSFRELLGRTRRAALGAYANQELPFERLVDALQPARDLSRSPLFQAMFVLQNEPLPPLELAGLKLVPLPAHSGTAKFELMLSLTENDGGLSGFVEYNTDLFNAETLSRWMGNYRTLLGSAIADPEQRLSQLRLLTDAERKQVLTGCHGRRAEFAKDKCVHQLFEEQVERMPDAVAAVFADAQLTYRQLDQRANHLAHELRALGVGPDVRVGVCVKRSLEMMVGLWGILKAGGCYVPLDPYYPRERLAFMLEDAQVPVLLTQDKLRAALNLELPNLKLLCLDEPAFNPGGPTRPTAPPSGVTPRNLAYVIYTSGSTGKPKGVMVTHRNVVNFFAGMDRLLGTGPGVWLALTSISFDISVLELFWTLTRGFKVIIQPDDALRAPARRATPAGKKIDFSLFYFATDDGARARNKYRLLIEGAKFADEHGFAAVWTPERHFHPFGALYPNPAVTSAALAMTTQRIQIRAGSVVLPLHHPIRVAEEWSVVDNLSDGRVAISFASGWHDRDFALAPENYGRRKELMFGQIETVRRLWRGESIRCRTGGGGEADLRIYPRPVQKELPVWLTTAGHPETFRKAGALGANLLTHLLGQNLEDLAGKIRTYRAARAEHREGEGRVALMVHTFVGTDLERVRETVRRPFCDYLKSSADLLRSLANNWIGDGVDLKGVAGEDLEALAQHGFDRYFSRYGLLGTPESCLPMLDQLKDIGVDEVACLIDFGVGEDSVLGSLPELARLRDLCNRPAAPIAQGRSLPDEILRHGVTHMQCTPSLAGALVAAPESFAALRRLNTLLVGGEALPVSLAKQLREHAGCRLINLYGPTETTVWSAAHRVDGINATIPIGRPLANTAIYILDPNLQPVPTGVPGEIFIGGEGVARGYLGRPELTAERFVRNPFEAEAVPRLYRTGDLGRFRADGTIEFLGRADQQVKIRGHRIELGEIETALGRHPAVRETVVVAREDMPGDKRLAAYIVAAPNGKPTAAELRRWTQAKLPEAMTPSVFVFLDALPLTPNGKVNRQALPRPQGGRPEMETAYVPARTAAEKAIARIWRELLLVEQVGLDDSFFDLGGNSLLLVQAQSRLREAVGRTLPVVRLFQYPTVRALAAFLGESEPAAPSRAQDRGRRKQAAAHRPREIEPALTA